jgi:5-methyltetrahydrofolate--homocysteine methyltransferase
VPLSIDSSVTGAIEAALKVAKGRPLVNSVTGEEEKLEAILPLCKKYDVPVVAISNDETGISEDPGRALRRRQEDRRARRRLRHQAA